MSTSRIIELYENGKWVGRAFQCKIDPDNPETFEYDFEGEYLRDQFLAKHDPNAIDSRHGNQKGVVNLGMRVNKVSGGKRRLL